jgi:hypothetical protein
VFARCSKATAFSRRATRNRAAPFQPAQRPGSVPNRIPAICSKFSNQKLFKRIEENVKKFNSAGRYAAWSGCLEPPESLEYKRWLASLPPFLLEIMAQELAEREAAKSKSSPSTDDLRN